MRCIHFIPSFLATTVIIPSTTRFTSTQSTSTTPPCVFSQWSNWTACPIECQDKPMQTRTRTIVSGRVCFDPLTETFPCNQSTCQQCTITREMCMEQLDRVPPLNNSTWKSLSRWVDLIRSSVPLSVQIWSAIWSIPPPVLSQLSLFVLVTSSTVMQLSSWITAHDWSVNQTAWNQWKLHVAVRSDIDCHENNPRPLSSIYSRGLQIDDLVRFDTL